jgi:hypothetical protein
MHKNELPSSNITEFIDTTGIFGDIFIFIKNGAAVATMDNKSKAGTIIFY